MLVQSRERSTVAEIVQEIMQKHVKGIAFRERDAGTKIDEKMQNEVPIPFQSYSSNLL